MKLCKVISFFGAMTLAAQAQNSAPAPAAPPVVVPSQRLPLAPGSQLPPGVLRPGQVPGALRPGQVLPGQVVPGQNLPGQITPLGRPNDMTVTNGMGVPGQQLAGTNAAQFNGEDFRTNGFGGAGTNAFNPVLGTNGDVVRA